MASPVSSYPFSQGRSRAERDEAQARSHHSRGAARGHAGVCAGPLGGLGAGRVRLGRGRVRRVWRARARVPLARERGD
jgi:hypothetical protein